MLLSEIKEREYRFSLALRMVLPIFFLFIILLSHTILKSSEILTISFYIESILILFISIYFIFYLIYKGFDTKITDSVSKAFTREYIYQYISKELKKQKDYTFILISIDNLYEINNKYGIGNGDKVLCETVKWINEYFKSKNIKNLAIGHISGSNFIIFLDGEKNIYKSIVELMCLKSQDIEIDNIEVNISSAMNDTKFSRNIDYIIENLFELQVKNKELKIVEPSLNEIDPTEYEYSVINALKRKDLAIFVQNVYKNSEVVFKECIIKLQNEESKLLHQKNYIKVLDKLRLMDDYDMTVLEKVIELCKKDNYSRYAISISPTSIRNSQTFAKIKELFGKNGCAEGRIIFILDESEYYPKIDKFNSLIKQLREIGILIALDRLGSIHTSFLYLKELNVDMIRLASFYSRDKNYEKYKNIISGFSMMAHQKDIKIWVKMVENKDILNSLKEADIDYVQGRYLSNIERVLK